MSKNLYGSGKTKRARVENLIETIPTSSPFTKAYICERLPDVSIHTVTAVLLEQERNGTIMVNRHIRTATVYCRVSDLKSKTEDQ